MLNTLFLNLVRTLELQSKHKKTIIEYNSNLWEIVCLASLFEGLRKERRANRRP